MKNLYLSSLLIVSLLSCTQNQNQAMKQCSFVYYIQGHEERAVAVPKKVQEYINCMVSEEGALIPDEFVGGLDAMTSGRYIVGNDSYSWVGNWGVLLSDVSKGDVMWPAFYLSFTSACLVGSSVVSIFGKQGSSGLDIRLNTP